MGSKQLIMMTTLLKKISIPLLICTLTLSSFNLSAKVDGIAAIVNNSVILNSEVNAMMNSVKANARKQDLPDNKTLRKQVIDQLINEKLILQEAEKAGIEINDADLDKSINMIAQQNNMSVAQLKNYITRTLKMDYNQYREQIRNEIVLEQTKIHNLRNNINVSDYEVNRVANSFQDRSYNNFAVHVSHLLIALPENPTQNQINEAKQKVNLVLGKLKKGESFAKLATSYSNSSDALQGGDLGWSPIGALPSLFESHLLKAKKGQVIGPIRSPAGYHILKVNDARSDAPASVNVTEVKAKHILIAVNILNTDEAAKAKIENIRDSIERGITTFDKAASLYSDDPGSASKGGELGWNNPDIFDPAFKKAVLSMNKGQLSQPVRSQFGWHLIELEDKRSVNSIKVAKKDYAYRMVFGKKFSEETQAWTQALRGDAYIKIMDE